MNISRRIFTKYCIDFADSLGLAPALISKLAKALDTSGDLPSIIWLAGASCSGCSVSLVNLILDFSGHGPADFPDLLSNYMNASLVKAFMTPSGDPIIKRDRTAQENDYILVVEGGIPTAFDGMACTLFTENGIEVTMLDAVKDLAPNAQAVVCVGACASYGGIPASGSNPIGIQTVAQCTGIPTINIPGCPAQSDSMAATIAKVLCGEEIVLDGDSRPVDIVHRTRE